MNYISIRSAASNLPNFAIWQKKYWPSKRLLKQEAEINQICYFSETSDDDDEADDGEGMTEIRFAPDDKATLQVMFSSMSHCQTLHPDPEAAEDAADEEAENDEVRSMLIMEFMSEDTKLVKFLPKGSSLNTFVFWENGGHHNLLSRLSDL